MADIRANQGKLYKALQGVGFKDLGSEEQFAAKLQDAGNRQKLYKALEKQGFKDLGDYDSFENRIYDGTKQATTFQNSLQQRMYPNGQIPTEPIKREEPQPAPRQETTPQQQQTKQEPAGAYKPTWQEQMAFGSTLGGAQYAVDNATKGIDQMEQASKQASPFGSGNVGIGNNQSLRKGKQTFDAEKGTFVDTYLTSDGREFRDLQQANNAQAELDNISGNIRYQEAMRQLGMTDIANEQDKDINQRLKEAYAERMELQRQIAEVAKKETASRKGPRFPSMVGGSAETYTMSDESKNLSSALRLLERRITALEAERDDEGQSMFWRGTTDTLKDPSAYSLGLTDLADTGVMSQLKSKLDAVNGDVSQLSNTEKALVRNYMMNQEAQRLNENRGNMYGFGQMFGQSLPFMAEFYLTGGFMGLGQAGTRLGTKAGLKMAGSELGKQMTKNLGGRILLKTGQSVLKGTGRVAGALAGGALQSNTIGAAKTYSDIANRNMGNLTLNDKGNLDFKDGEGIAEAFLKGQLTNAFENGSELLGPAFDFAPNYLARVIKNKVAGGAVNKLLSNKAWRGTNKVLRKFGVQGLFGEGMEEEANNIGNVLIGESNWFKDPNDPNKPAFFDGEEQFKTWAGVALTGAVLRGPAIAAGGYQKAQYYANKYNLNSSDNQMRSVLGDYDRYQSIKSMLDGATNENIGSVLNNIMNGGQLNDQEKEAVVFYAQDLVNLRGFNIGSVVAEAVGAQPQPRVASYQVKADGKSFDELDENGNVLAHHEYETNDEMKAGLYELQQQRFDDNLQSDISIMKTRPNGQFDQLVSDYLMQNELFMMPSDFEAILKKPSLERTEEEQQLVAPFSELLHNTVYDNTMLHEEQSQQDGEEIADADSIDIEAGSEQGTAINAEWQAAQQARNELFSRNEELAQEVLSRENNGLSHQEIISSLTTFRPEDVQAVIDFYNKKARYEGYINRKAQKIDEEAASSRQRHTMKGTIDGVADLNNVHTITDGTNRYYLVSGDITTDPATGRITGSTSGLIIGMDLDGSFVNLNESDGYSLEPVTMTLDQFEEAERIRLQEQVTAVIDPNGALNQQAEQSSEGSGQPVRTARTESPNSPDAVQGADTTGQAGAEAGASTGTGANEAPAALSSEPQQPQVTIESVTDKDGVKRYEQGIPVDDAIADIQNDGFDVNEIADASIGEAQQAIDKINKKPAKTRKDLMDRKSAQDVIDYYNNVKARWSEMNAETQPAESEEIVNIQPEQPIIEEKPVSSQQSLTVEEQKQQRIAEAKAKYGELFDDDFTKANDVYELVSMWVGRKRNLAWDDVNGKRGLQKELGWTRKIGGDTKYIETLLAKKGEGMGVDEFAHMVWESEENTVDGEKRYTTEEIKEALLELLKSAGSKSDVVDYALNTRINAAEAAMQEQQKRDEEEAQEQQPLEPLTAEQMADIENNLPFAQSTDEEIEDAPINQLRREIDSLMQEEGTPNIQLVDTERMTDDEWQELLSGMMGYFLSQEEIDDLRQNAIQQGVLYSPETGNITVLSGVVTPEDVRTKVEQIKEELSNEEVEQGTDGSSDEQSRGTDMGAVPAGNAQEYSAESEGETGSTSTTSQGSAEPRVDDYLQPRNAEEEAIVQGVINQLQQEIQAAIEEENKARADLEKARTKESDRATDMFANDETFAEPDAIFSQEEMGLDTSAEGVDRRTSAQRERLHEAVNKKNKLQSEQERNSRIRGALDNHRKQTKIETDNPIEAIEQSAQSFAQERQEKPKPKSNNKVFTDEAHEEVLKKLRAKFNNLNAGFDPEIALLMLQDAGYHIEKGARKIAECAKAMIDELGDFVRPYIKSAYNAVRDYPGMEKIANEMSSFEEVQAFDPLNFDKAEQQTVNVNKKENNKPENVVSSQQETDLQGDSAEFAERQKKIERLRNMITDRLRSIVRDGYAVKPLSEYKKFVEIAGIKNMSDTDLQEIIEACIVDLAREFANNDLASEEKKFNWIVKLYNGQPTLSVRDNDRINKQQYSTPAPMAFLMGQFLSNGKEVNSGLEPSAGNGMLTINLPKEKMHVNDIDEMRISNLQKQGFGEVTSQDGLQPFGEKKYDVVVTNPPFGNVTAKTYDGLYEISGLEHQMTINALESMKDDGRAAIIIGGNTEYNQNGSIKGKDRAFLNYLYSHYNVVDVINMDGKTLYSRQGTGYPVRMILINGRKEFNPKDFAPVQSKARAEQVKTYEELYNRVNDDILRNTVPTNGQNVGESVSATNNGQESGESNEGNTSGVDNHADTKPVQGTGTGGSRQPTSGENGGRRLQRPGGVDSQTKPGTDTGESGEVRGSTSADNSGQQVEQYDRQTSGTNGRQRGFSDSNGLDGQPSTSGGRLAVDEKQQVKRELGTEKVPYRKQSSNPFDLQSQMPAEQAEVVKKALEDIGDVDSFLVKELGYASVDDLHHGSQSPDNHGGLAAEQVDSVALAIKQMKNGGAFIIGDQTGIGKGRQGAALIRWGVKQGGNPVYITKNPELFSGVYRDLKDIGSAGLRPFILAADGNTAANITDKGEVIYKAPSKKEKERVINYIKKNGKLPPEYDFLITNYDSFSNGTMEYENGQKKARSFGKKRPGPAAYNGQEKRDMLEALSGNSYVIMDESHMAGGESARGSFLQYITSKAKGITFISATFAKRPDNMPIYSLRTAISKAGVNVEELIDAVKRGGTPFQEIMSKALTEAGQMIRRERDMTGVTIDWKGIDDETVVQQQREQYDQVISLFNDIINFQRTYVDSIVNGMNDAAAEEQGSVDHTPGTRDMGINNTPFASKTYQIVKKVLLSLKAEEGAKRAIEHLKAGRKPVIAVENTNEGAADRATGSNSEDMEMPDLSITLKEGLQGTLRIQTTDAFGNKVQSSIPFEKLSEEGQRRYQEIMDAIDRSSTGLSLSPIDVMKNELKKAGYKVGELTGRQQEFVYNEDGTVKRVKRQDRDKKKVADDFNQGKLDVVILNRSAGTGIDLHASTKFADQKPRIMVVVQAQQDVNDEVQMRGRIDRTGQVQHGMYEYVVSQIPSEQRLLMMLKAKLSSLDANTTSSQKSKFNEMQVQDIINKYGDEVVIQYLAEHTDLAAKMCDPLKWGEGFESLAPETLASNIGISRGEAGSIASKVLGRMALLTVKEQEKMLKEIGDLYQAEIDRLNEMGENDLEITEMPLRAKTVKKNVWEEGVEPGGKNPFADNSYVEEVEMDVLRKPMKAEEVKKAQDRLLGGKTWDEYKKDVYDKINEWADKKKEETTKTFTERAEKKATAEKEKYAKGAKKAQEKNGMTDEEIELNAGYQYDTFYKQEMEKLDNAIEAIDKQKQVFVDALETFSIERVYALPTDIYDLSQLTFEPSFGRVIGIDIKEDNYSTTASTITFATLDGRRKVTIPISGMVKQNNGEKKDIKPVIVQQTAQTRSGFFGSNIKHMLDVLELDLPNWDRLTSTATRKKGYIITGNLLKALTSLRRQGKGGKLISYTTDNEEIRQGILMGDKFDPGTLTSKNPISSAKKDLEDFNKDNKIVSADGNITVKRGRYDWRNNAYSYTLQVPKSKKKGDIYFNDKTLLSLMEGQFEGSTKMSADFPSDNLDAVLKRLDELGVTVESAKEESDARVISTSDPMEAIEKANHAFRQARGFYQRTKEELEEITKRVMDIPKRFGLKAAITQVINSRSELEQLKGKVSDKVYKMIEQGYNKPGVTGVHISGVGIVVVFGEKVKDADDAELTWWHEQTHNFWHSLPADLRDRYGSVCFNILKKYYPDVLDSVTGYSPDKWKNEACSFLVESIVNQYGADAFMSFKFGGNQNFINFANELREYLKNGTGKQQGHLSNNQRKGIGSVSRGSDAHRRDNLRQERKGSGSLLQAQSELQETGEVDFRSTDPLEAISRAAEGFRDGQVNNPVAHSAKAIYNERLNRVETVFSEAYQDAMVSLKTAQNAIAGDKEIPDSQNAYMAENLMHGKNKNEQDLFNRMFRDPLIRTINKIMNVTGMNWGDVDRYVYTKSGLERNREFFVRDWLEAERNKTIRRYEDLNDAEQSIFERMAARIEEDFEDGTIATEEEKNKKLAQALQRAHTEYVNQIEQEYLNIKNEKFQDMQDSVINFPDYLAAIDNFIRRNIDYSYEPSEHDYSGFRAMFGDEEGNYSEADIIEELMVNEDIIGADDVNTIWEQINAATQYGLERYREAGMRSDEDIDRVEQMFHFYVPMRGFKAETGEDIYQYFTGKDKSKSYVGGLLKHAKGRGSEAEYPISTIFAMSYKAIADCNQNLVNQKFYRLCQANPNDLVVLSDSWAVYDEIEGIWKESVPEIGDDMSEEEIRETTLAWEEQMRQLALERKAKKITGKAEFDYKPMDKKNQSEHIVNVRINGQPKKMVVTSNPRMAQALNGQLRFEHGKNVFSRWNAAIKNMMATFFTSYSPTFALRNMFRDWTHFRMMLGVREGHGYAQQANKYYRQSLFKMVGLFKKYREGTLDESKEIERDFKDFMDNGGITGFVFMQKIDDIQKEMENIYKKQKAGKPIRLNNNLWEKILGAVEALNEGIENNARFATYRASRHYAGRTKARSAYDAKEITVNFNRKGAGSKTAGFKSTNKMAEDAAKAFGVTAQILGEGKIFFNATVQAIATTFKNFQNADGSLNKKYIAKWAAKYALPPFMFGLALPMINKALAAALGGDGDDDPYANLPEWTRRKNICIWAGWIPGLNNNSFITIPIGQELAAFLTLGDIVAGNTYAPDLKPVDRSWDDEMLGVMNTFSPVDVDTKITKGGLMEDPISEVAGRTFSVLAPLVAVEQNLGWTGRPIYREDKFGNDQYTPEYQMVYQSTNPVLVNASKLLHELGGGDDITRGKFEVNPAIVQYLWEQYTGGPGKVFSNTISIGKDAKDLFVEGEMPDFNIRKVEGLKAFVQQGDDRTAYYRVQAKYRKYKEDAERLYDAVKGYEGGAAENPEYLLKLEQITKGENFVKMQIVREADKQLSQINKAANKAEGKERKELRKMYNERVKQVVDMLDDIKGIEPNTSPNQ